MLTAYDPFSGASATFRALDQLTGRQGGMSTARALSGMPMDAYRVGDNFVAHFDLPGVDPGSIDVSVEGNALTVTAARTTPSGVGDYLVSERPRGRYSRQLLLGRDLDTDRLHASYTDGVLTLTIPRPQPPQPKRVQITAGGEPRTIETGGTEQPRETAAA